MTKRKALTDLESSLRYSFREPALLEAALVHRSYTSEHPKVPDNERLEFLGDAVLQLAVTLHLFETYPGLDEGQLAKVRAASVNRDVLAEVARSLGVGDYLVMGLGEVQSGGREKESILGDAMEAILAAIYLDSDFPTTQDLILGHWRELVDQKAESPGRRDFKTRFQEILATSGRQPRYVVTGSGPDHKRAFEAVVSVDDVELGRGTGRSKKEAEQEAARTALETSPGSA